MLIICKKKCLILFSLLSFFILSNNTSAATDQEVLSSAIEKGKLVANYWLQKSGANTSSDYYADICSFYGVCIFGDATGDSSFFKEINKKYNRTTPIKTNDIDQNSCGILPLHLFLHTKDPNHLKLGKDAADANISKNGHVRNAIDDTYMTGSLMIQAYRATNDTKYLDFCVNYFTTYMNNLQQSNGLYWHHKDISKQFWGRGNGWGAACAAELIQVLPQSHSKYQQVLQGYKKQMNGLIQVQNESGMWNQLLGSNSPKNWEETSGTAMFLFAIFTGLHLKLLDEETYLEPAKKGWMALTQHLSSDGKLGNIADGFWPKSGTADEYLNASKGNPGNSHGTAGILWAATAIVRYYTGNVNITLKQPHNSQRFHTVFPSKADLLFNLNGRKFSSSGFHPNNDRLTSGALICVNNAGKLMIIIH